ncbi:N-acetyltransferase [Clostridium gelidum]|uniref:N-acetyltransferase n=1 Tax=Clostridium gelidum TaxID=704125 RepID=A0ABM7T4F6_9CLOT|nr:GNAT family N-acetyltransferase [Clostridium gelidum]BCZ46164.1 N-acetyltransferase [Clostridium gelidum]
MKDLINNTDLIIRNAETRDAEGIIQLVKQVMKESPFFPRTSDEFNFTIEQEEKYIKNAALFLVAEVNGNIIGSATLDRSELVRLNHAALFGITILKAFSHQGVGSALMKKVIEWAELNRIEKIDLEVFENNTQAISLYKKFAFIEEGRKIKAIKTNKGYEGIILMCKFLNN